MSTKPLPMEEFIPESFLYESKEMYISIPKSHMSFMPGTHVHSGFEFMIPLIDMPFIEIDKREMVVPKNHILPINPNQEHGVTRLMTDVRFIDILIDELYMHKIVLDIFGIGDIRFSTGTCGISAEMQTVLRIFIKEAKENKAGKGLILQSLGFYIVSLILREVRNNTPYFEHLLKDVSAYRVRKAISYMKANYKSINSLKEVADAANMSNYHLIRVFKDCTGKTPYDYLLDFRINQAKILLAQKFMTIIEICFECGFNNVSHFTRFFKKKTGVSPSHYRAMLSDEVKQK
jgi:AraC-like DNA-binding protein